MAYNRLNLSSGQVFQAKHVRHLEDALEQALSGVSNNSNAQVFVVNFTLTDESFAADKTFAEILIAIEKNYVIQGVVDINNEASLNLNLLGYTDEVIIFTALMGTESIMLVINNDDTYEDDGYELLTPNNLSALTIKYSNNSTTTYTPHQGSATINIPSIDTTLTKSGYAADAKIVGNKISTLNTKIDDGLSLLDDSLNETTQQINLIKLDTIPDLQEQITANANAITLLSDGADPDTIDSVKDLINYVNEHGATTEQIQKDIEALENASNVYEISSDSSVTDELVKLLPTTIYKGDVMIVTNSLGVKSAYQYDGEWIACDGNVDATKVIMPYDITLAGSYTRVGNLTKTSTGTATFATKGKSVAAALQEILSKREQPTITSYPAVSFNSVTTGAYEVGTKITPSWEVSLSPGSYTYGPPTGITASTWEIRNTEGRTSSLASSSFPQITVLDETNYAITAIASYKTGATAYDNLGEISNPIIIIDANTATKTATPITGYRSWFMYIGTDNTSTIDSAFIRSNATNMGNGSAAVTQNSVVIPAGTKRIIIALPKQYGKTLSSIIDINGMGLDVISNFTQSVRSIDGCNNVSSLKQYDVWILENANGLAATKYNFIIN